jgi:peptidoglycan LD-endopeptidase LytH
VRLSAVLLVVVLAFAGDVAPAFAELDVDGDPAVVEARRRAEEAERRLAATASELDEAAAAYEHAAAQHLRLVNELEGSDKRLEEAEEAIARAEHALARRLLELYRRPYETMAVVEALAEGESLAGTLHTAALLEHAAASGVHGVTRARRTGALTAEAVRQQQIIAGGLRAAAQDRQEAAEALTLAVAEAQRQRDASLALLGEARRDAAARLEAQRAAAEAASRYAASGPPPRVDGRVCPIGGPNGFVDSWGFPRSGGRSHQGVDMFAPYGTPLYAVGDGIVTRVGTNALGGLTVDLVDEAGDRFYYAHLSAALVQTGQPVQAGQVIGENGDSGNARGTPPHLHWQFHPGGGAPVNPYPLALALCRPS